MLAMTCERAEIEDGQQILELGCGWGSLSLWMARNYPNARITAVSNSTTQKEYIDSHALPNLTVITADMNTFTTDETFDRIVSIEMFEHMRNWPKLLSAFRDGYLVMVASLSISLYTVSSPICLTKRAGKLDVRTFFQGGYDASRVPFRHL